MKPLTLTESMKYLIWSILLLIFNINFGSLIVTPDWLGYFCLLRALPAIEKEVSISPHLRPLCFCLMIYAGIMWLWALFSQSIILLNTGIAIVGVIAIIASIYVQFLLVTSVAELAQTYHSATQPKLLLMRNVRTSLMALHLACWVIVMLHWISALYTLVTILSLCAIGVGLNICYVVFCLRREISDDLEGSL